jgi:hypothetical protein
LEKDAWVVWTIERLFSGPDAPSLVFKGGTSLSKAHHVIRRFSEDIDVTYDIRALLGERAGSGIPPSRSQAGKWTHAVREQLPTWISATVVPQLHEALSRYGIEGVELDHDYETVSLRYKPVAEIAYIQPIVRIEFGARSTGEPVVQLPVVCDAEEHLTAEGVSFPRVTPRVMAAERTFWEKATSMHVFCVRGTFRGGDRFARHWYDVAKLDQSGHVDEALADSAIGEDVALHKGLFFIEPGVDYVAAVRGGLNIIPTGDPLATLKADYKLMVESNMFMEVEPDTFDEIIASCQSIQDKVNDRTKS